MNQIYLSLQRANAFVQRLENPESSRNVVQFMLNNNLQATLPELIEAAGLDPEGDREHFQQTILQDLKQDGIVATTLGPTGRIYIPESTADARRSIKSITSRVASELGNLLPIIEDPDDILRIQGLHHLAEQVANLYHENLD